VDEETLVRRLQVDRYGLAAVGGEEGQRGDARGDAPPPEEAVFLEITPLAAADHVRAAARRSRAAPGYHPRNAMRLASNRP